MTVVATIRRENFKRTVRAAAEKQRAKTHCRNGHEYTERNTRYSPDGTRICRACKAVAQRRSKRKHSSENVPRHYRRALKNCFPPGSRISHSKRELVVPTGMLAEEIRTHLPKLDARAMSWQVLADGTEVLNGGKRLMCERAGLALGLSWETLYRRVYDILNGRVMSTNLSLAEALLAACDVDIYHDTSIPILAAGRKAAVEMTDATYEDPERADVVERRRIAAGVEEVSATFITGLDRIDRHILVGLWKLFGLAPERTLRRRHDREDKDPGGTVAAEPRAAG